MALPFPFPRISGLRNPRDLHRASWDRDHYASVRWFAMRVGSGGKLTATGLPPEQSSRVEGMDAARPRTAGLIAGPLRSAARRREASPGPWPAIGPSDRAFSEPLPVDPG